MEFNIWEGVYTSFEEVPRIGHGFNQNRWVEAVLQKTLSVKEDHENISSTIPQFPSYSKSLLPLLTAVVKTKYEKMRILDFGGGLGIDYLRTINSQTNSETYYYHIVENEILCDHGNRLFDQDRNIVYHLSILTDCKFDIIYSSSSVQYVEDWKGIITQFSSVSTQYLLLTDLPAGDIPTFATAQNYYGSKIPSWFFNISEFIEYTASQGFALQFCSTYKGNILGKYDYLPQDNFPEYYRLGRSCNLLFTKS